MHLETKKILVVDDVADDRLVAKIILEKEGYIVVEAKDWREALAVIKKGGLALILLDLRMPEVDGLELLGKIRQENSSEELPVLIYSSAPNTGDDYKFYGSNGYVKKYCDPAALISKVNGARKKMA